MGPSSIILASAARWVSLSFERWPGAFLSMRPSGAIGVELHDPVTPNMQRQSDDFRSLSARCLIGDRRQSQSASRQLPVFCLAGDRPLLQRVKIRPERSWHCESPRSPYRIKFAASRESQAESSSQGIEEGLRALHSFHQKPENRAALRQGTL